MYVQVVGSTLIREQVDFEEIELNTEIDNLANKYMGCGEIEIVSPDSLVGGEDE